MDTAIQDSTGRPGQARRTLFGRRLAPRGGSRDSASCCIVGVLVLVDKALPIDGLVTEIGPWGVLFRPASVYILDRSGAEVAVRFGDQDVRGRITEVGPRGYGIRLMVELTPQVVADVVAQFGLTGMDAR